MPKKLLPGALILLLIVILLVVIVIVLIRRGGDDVGPEPPPVSLATEEIATLRNASLALLENQTPREAFPPLEELSAHAPAHAAFARQNLLVAITLALELENAEANPQPFQDLFTRAAAAFEPPFPEAVDRAELAMLRSRIARIAGDMEIRVSAAKQATELAPESAAAWYEYYRAMQESPPAAESAGDAKPVGATEPIAVLGRCVQVAPENSWALMEYMVELAQARDKAILAPLEQLQETLAPFAPAITQRSRVDILQTFAQTAEAVREEEWNTVIRNARLISNVIRPEDLAQSDRAVLVPNTLEFVNTAMPKEFAAELHSQIVTAERLKPEFTPQTIALPELTEPIRQCELADMNLNGDLELLVLSPSKLRVFTRENNRWSVLATAEPAEGFSSIVLADLDGDADATAPPTVTGAPCAMADLDLVLCGSAGATVLENRIRDGGGLVPHPLAAVTEAATFVTPGDFDLDGDLDLLLGTGSGRLQLLANHQQFEFRDISNRSSLPDNAAWIKAVAVDLDRDIDLDAVVIAPDRIVLLENLRHGELRSKPLQLFPTPAGEGEKGGITDIAVTDLNADARWDLLICRKGEDIGAAFSDFSMPGRIAFEPAVNAGCHGDRLALWDCDNDGWQDLAVLGGEDPHCALVRRRGPAEFAPEETVLAETGEAEAMLVEDVDQDGDLDLLSWSDNKVVWQDNRHGNENGYLKVMLLGQQIKGDQAAASGRVNQYGWGSLLELKAGTMYQAQVANRATTHFGLGDLRQAGVLRVVWTNGIPQNVIAPQRNQVLCEELKLKGSCPYLYTWDGEKFVFHTDLLWAAPIGLQFAEGVLAPTRPWEYLLIEGNRLQARDGEYRLQITEELWEAAYFDQVELIAVDHPADIAVYSNEKVASSSVPEFKIHTVRNPRAVKAATDSRGRDVLSQIAERDGVYTKLFDVKHYQGVTNEHYLELDLGDVDRSGPMKLFLTGWVYPSDTSINVALGQNPDAPKGRPPLLQTLDESGNWVTVDPGMGFPGGKTKTIVVDLAGKFRGPQSRLRIVTSMELYWDHVFFTAGEPEAADDLRTRPLELLSADLHYRGFSRRVPDAGNGPESFDYAEVTRDPIWPAMIGPFTAYGDPHIADLLRQEDDRSVVMGAGDEMTVTFRVPAEPPPKGWTRDFILHNVGYDKDADLNTIYGRSSEPYPTRANPINPAVESGGNAANEGSAESRQQPQRAFWTAIRDYSPAVPEKSD